MTYANGLWDAGFQRFWALDDHGDAPCNPEDGAGCPTSEPPARQPDLAQDRWLLRPYLRRRSWRAPLGLARSCARRRRNMNLCLHAALQGQQHRLEPVRYDGPCSKQARVERTFDGYGNINPEVNKGDVAFSGDEVTTQVDYYPNANRFITALPGRSRSFAGVAQGDEDNGDAGPV